LQQKIFEPYFTTKPVGEGSGLGLAVVHGIVQGYGGAIAVESTSGEGSLFRIYLPCLESKSDKEAKDSFVPAHGHGRIMFVDDEDSITELNRKILERLSYQVTTCKNGQAALEIFRQNPDSFDLIITDQTMPQMIGVKLAQEIWMTSPQMPIIICTGFSEELTLEKATEMGFSTLLIKPVTMLELSRAIQEAMLAEPRPV
jgi:CheY-like chemotaxis protein